MVPGRRTLATSGGVAAAITGTGLFGDLVAHLAVGSDAVSTPAAYEAVSSFTYGLSLLAVFVLPAVAAYWLVRGSESVAVGRVLASFAAASWLAVFAFAAYYNATAAGVLATHRGLHYVTTRSVLPFLPAVLGVLAGHVLHHDGPLFGPAFEAPRPEEGPESE